MGLSVGANVLVARQIGAKEEEAVKKTVHTSIALSILGGILLTVFGLVFALACQIAVSTPAASAATAMVFGNTDWVEKGYAYKIGVLTLIFWLAAALAIMIPFAMLIF